MIILATQYATETNTFVTEKTTLSDFQKRHLSLSNGSMALHAGAHEILRFWRDRTHALGHSYTESIAATAEPGGPIVQETYQFLRDKIVFDAKAHKPDIVLLALHGAMAAEDELDCEGDLLTALRHALGANTTIAAMLDPHAHLSRRMLDAADILVFMKEYPHTDGIEAAGKAFDLALQAACGQIKPVMTMRDVPVVGIWRTQEPRIRALVDWMNALEQSPGVLSISFVHGFPWGDTPDSGAKALVITDDDPDRAKDTAARVAQRIWEERNESDPPFMDFEDAVHAAQAMPEKGPCAIADIADNPGGGAPGDATYGVRALMRLGVKNSIVATIHDPAAVDTCFKSGAHATVDLVIGGKHGESSGPPVSGAARVIALNPVLRQQGLAGETGVCFGRAALIELNGVQIILAEERIQVFSPCVFSNMGVDINEKRILVVKSTNHFYEQFHPVVAACFWANSPGALNMDFASLPYRHASTDYWPRVNMPSAGAVYVNS